MSENLAKEGDSPIDCFLWFAEWTSKNPQNPTNNLHCLGLDNLSNEC